MFQWVSEWQECLYSVKQQLQISISERSKKVWEVKRSFLVVLQWFPICVSVPHSPVKSQFQFLPSHHLPNRISYFMTTRPRAGLRPAGPRWIVGRVQFSWAHFSRLASRLRRSARTFLVRNRPLQSANGCPLCLKTVTNGVSTGALSDKNRD